MAAKQLKTDNEEASEKILEEFFNEIKTMKGLNHPNLIQLFAFTTGNSNFMIQEFMSEGDLKNYLQKLKKDPDRMKADTKLWSKLLSWNIEVARGMERLESLKIVHRDLAARYHTEVFLLCKSRFFSGMCCWISFSGRRLQTLVLQWSQVKGESRREKSCQSNGLPLRHFFNDSSPACEKLYSLKIIGQRHMFL